MLALSGMCFWLDAVALGTVTEEAGSGTAEWVPRESRMGKQGLCLPGEELDGGTGLGRMTFLVVSVAFLGKALLWGLGTMS